MRKLMVKKINSEGLRTLLPPGPHVRLDSRIIRFPTGSVARQFFHSRTGGPIYASPLENFSSRNIVATGSYWCPRAGYSFRSRFHAGFLRIESAPGAG